MVSEACLLRIMSETTPPSEAIRARWLAAYLPDVPAAGWNDIAARAAAERAGISAGEQALAAPHGVIDLLETFFEDAEAKTRAALAEADLATLKVHERVALGVRTWLDQLTPHREAVGKAAAYGFLPWGAGPALQRAWSVADTVWSGIGDTSEDYNYYTKRGLLASVLPPIVLYWQDAPTEDDLDAYIARRLKGAMEIGRAGGRILGPVLEAIGGKRDPSA